MICSKCGAKIKQRAKFCPKCGSKVEIDYTVKSQGKSLDQSKVLSGKTPVVLTIVVLAVVGIATGAVLLFNSAPKKTDYTQQSLAESGYDDQADSSEEESKEDEESEQDTFEEESNMDADEETSDEDEDMNDYEDTEDTYEDTGEYILPESDSKNYHMSDLKGLSKEEARLARNEIYARRGRIFTDSELRDYFSSKGWYSGTIEPDDFDDASIFNDYEIHNRNLLLKYEAQLTGKEDSTSDRKIKKSLVKSITASSELNEISIVHIAGRIWDGSLEKAWVEGASGQGIGENITFHLKKTCKISGFKINAGYQKSEDLYYKNSRPKKISIYLSSGDALEAELEDEYGVQAFDFEEPILADEITVEIDSVYEGDKYEDTVISELEWY